MMIKINDPPPRKPKLRIRFAKSAASASVTGRHSDLHDKEVVPHSPSTTEGSEDSGDLGDGSPGSQRQQHAQQTLDPALCNETAEDLSRKMVLDTTKSTDSERKRE